MKKNNVVYGIGNLGYSVISQTVCNFFVFFGTSVLKLSGVLVGTAVAISTIWDGLTDPIVGYISDRYRIGKLGYRKGYMLIATIGMMLCNLLVWFVPVGTNNVVKFIWIILSLILLETFNTMYSTPYSALGSDLADEYHDRTKIQISKTIFFIIGMIVPSVLIAVCLPNTTEYPIGQLNPNGYKVIAIISSFICLVSGVLCIVFTKENNGIKPYVSDNKLSIKQMLVDFVSTLKNKSLRVIILGDSISMIAGIILTSVGMHFFTYCFYYTSTQITIILFTLLVATCVSQPLWFTISKKRDKKFALLIAILVSVVGAFSVMLVYVFRFKISAVSFYFAIISMFICGFGSGALYSLPSSIYSDEVSAINEREGLSKTATYTGMLTFAGNIASAVTLLIVGGLLDIIGFDGEALDQSLSVQTGLALMLFVGVMVVLLISYYMFSLYSPTKLNNDSKKVEKFVQE